MLSDQDPQLPAQPRQHPLPLLQPRLRHRDRLRLLVRHLAVPEPRHQRGDLARQDRQARHRHFDVGGAGVHAAVSDPGDDRLHQPDGAARRPLRHLGLVRGCHRPAGLPPLLHQVRRRQRAFSRASHGNVHTVAARRQPEQPDGADGRALCAVADPDARPAIPDRAGIARYTTAQGPEAETAAIQNGGAESRPADRRLHLLPHPDGGLRRADRRFALGLLLGADGHARPHARRGRLCGPAHPEPQELPAPEIRARPAHHLPARRRQGARPLRLAQRTRRGRRPFPQPQTGAQQAHRRAPDREPHRHRALRRDGGIGGCSAYRRAATGLSRSACGAWATCGRYSVHNRFASVIFSRHATHPYFYHSQ